MKSPLFDNGNITQTFRFNHYLACKRIKLQTSPVLQQSLNWSTWNRSNSRSSYRKSKFNLPRASHTKYGLGLHQLLFNLRGAGSGLPSHPLSYIFSLLGSNSGHIDDYKFSLQPCTDWKSYLDVFSSRFTALDFENYFSTLPSIVITRKKPREISTRDHYRILRPTNSLKLTRA